MLRCWMSLEEIRQNADFLILLIGFFGFGDGRHCDTIRSKLSQLNSNYVDWWCTWPALRNWQLPDLVQFLSRSGQICPRSPPDLASRLLKLTRTGPDLSRSWKNWWTTVQIWEKLMKNCPDLGKTSEQLSRSGWELEEKWMNLWISCDETDWIQLFWRKKRDSSSSMYRKGLTHELFTPNFVFFGPFIAKTAGCDPVF